MSQSTDTTPVVPLAESPLAQPDMEATVTMPVVAPVAPAVPVVPPQPPFDAARARLLHLHRVLGRILNTPQLPTPDRADLHTYGAGIDLLIRNDLDGTALLPYVAVFGGTPTTVDRASSWAESGMQRYAELLTVVDGAEVRVWSLTDLPAVEQTDDEPCTHEILHKSCCAGCGEFLTPEPEPQHDPAPVPAPETPVEHPEAA